MAESIPVTNAELEKAIRIWITTAPKRIWRDYWNHSETAGKWGGGNDPFDRFDPRHALAKYLAERFAQANWSVAHPEWDGRMADTKFRMKEAQREGEAPPATPAPST